MEVFAEQILSYKSIYLIATGAYITLVITSVTYLISKRKIKPKYFGIPIALIVSFFHLYSASLDWNTKNISTAIFMSVLIYVAAFGLASSIATIVRSTSQRDEMDVTFGTKG